MNTITETAYNYILEHHFFEHRDRNVAAEETPLFRHINGAEDLSVPVAQATGISIEEAARLLGDAFEEVRL